MAKRGADLGEAPGTSIVMVGVVVSELAPLVNVLAPASGAGVDRVRVHVPELVGLDAEHVAFEFRIVWYCSLSLLDGIARRPFLVQFHPVVGPFVQSRKPSPGPQILFVHHE